MPLTLENANQRVLEAEYAVRGPIVARAQQIAEELKKPETQKKYPFDSMVFCNIGNPQAVKQPPLSYPREISALLTAPHLLSAPNVTQLYPKDVVERAKWTLARMANSGGYTNSAGYDFARKHIADFITARDEANNGGKAILPKADPSTIFLTNGASQGVTFTLQLLINKPNDGVMIPIPQYPLYTATLTLLNGTMVPYYLDEAKNWGITAEQLEESYDKAVQRGVNVRAITIINPGNPTGQVLDLDVMKTVVEFAHRRRLVILSDEVYQENIYAPGKKFHSMREVVLSMGATVSKEVQVFSFHSASKGIHGECGRRGGYLELLNFPKDVFDAFVKLPSINLCPNIMGQIMMDIIVKPPAQGDESYPKFRKEYDAIFEGLKRRARALPVSLRKVPGITCNDIEGAMYAFPQLRLPKKFIESCESAGKKPDAVWCMGLVEQEGIVTVPGSGFGQVPGTYHFRTTILPPDEDMERVARRIDAYQRRIIANYGPIAGSRL